MLGLLDDLLQRLDAVAACGATNRYYTLQPLELVDVAVRAAGDGPAVGPAASGSLADDGFLTRKRIARDVAAQTGSG